MKILKYLLCVGIVFQFVGCGIADKSASNVLRSKNNQYIVNTVPLNEKVKIVGFKSIFRNNLLLASVDIQNNNQATYDLEYKISWLDNDGFEVAKTPWLPLHMNAMELRSIQRIATTPKAESFKFYLRLKQ